MQQRHSALTSANIVIFSDSQPRLQKIGPSRHSARNRGQLDSPSFLSCLLLPTELFIVDNE